MVVSNSSAGALTTLLEARLRQVQHMGATGLIEREAVRMADDRIVRRSRLLSNNNDCAVFNDYCARRESLWGTGPPIMHEWSRTRFQGLRNTAYNVSTNLRNVVTTLIAWAVSFSPEYALPKTS